MWTVRLLLTQVHPIRPSKDLLCSPKRPALRGSMVCTFGMSPKASVPGLASSWFVVLKKSQLFTDLEFCEPVVKHRHVSN